MRSNSHVTTDTHGRPKVADEVKAAMASRFAALLAARGYTQDDVAERSGPHEDDPSRTALLRTEPNGHARSAAREACSPQTYFLERSS